MSEKKVSYISVLKEAINEFDTSKNVDVKGPLLDPILGYDGGGELPTHKDAASILERYYFKEKIDKGINISALDEEANIPQVGKDKAALDEEPENVDTSKKDIAKAVAQTDGNPDEGTIAPAKLESENTVVEEMENAVIENLIAEMEEELDETAQIEEQDAKTITAGTEERDARELIPAPKPGQVPDRKDGVDVKEAQEPVKEEEAKEEEAKEKPAEEKPAEEEPAEEAKEEETLDVDKKIKNESLGPDLRSSANDPEDSGAKDEKLEEEFKIFKEAIADEEGDVVAGGEEEPTETDSKKIASDEIRI